MLFADTDFVLKSVFAQMYMQSRLSAAQKGSLSWPEKVYW